VREIVLVGERGQVVCGSCEVAEGFVARLRGLLGRKRLEAGAGMLFRPANSVHTIGMRFPIDVVYLDRNLTVLEVVRRLGPWRVSACWRAQAVLELSAGECERLALAVGDRLSASG
jgi:uncharacterized membrane protein (UPF0127 family)